MRDFLVLAAVATAFALGYYIGRTVTGLIPLLTRFVVWLEGGDGKKKPPGGAGA